MAQIRRDGVTEVADVLETALETGLVRTGAALDALRGGPVGPPVGVRRWPYAVVAAIAGAAAGAAVALLVGRLLGSDAPDAQEPEDVQAVVDRDVERNVERSAGAGVDGALRP